MLKKKILTRKTFRFILPAFAAGALIASAVSPTNVKAEESDPSKLPVYDITVGDSTLTNALKENVITDRAANDENIDLESVNIERSTIDVNGLDYSRTGLQTATVKVNLVSNDSTAGTLGYTFVEDIAVNVKKDAAPKLALRSDAVTVNNGDTFNAENYIAYISDDSNTLPALKISSAVDTATDGTYTVTYTAVDTTGNSTTKNLTVTVSTPQEVLDAQAAAEAQAQAEAEAQAAAEEAQRQAEEAARLAEEQQQAAQQSSYYQGAGAISGDGNNPYVGGFGNCTAGAWLLEAQRGVYLPNFGNAWNWLGNAQASGYSTGSTPAVGAVAVYSHHVAVVTGVNADGSVNIAEGGFNGGYNERTVSAWGTGTQSLQGYIYTN